MGFTISEILVTADVKKLLNSFAIAALSVMLWPLIKIESNLFKSVLVLIAFLRSPMFC